MGSSVLTHRYWETQKIWIYWWALSNKHYQWQTEHSNEQSVEIDEKDLCLFLQYLLHPTWKIQVGLLCFFHTCHHFGRSKSLLYIQEPLDKTKPLITNPNFSFLFLFAGFSHKVCRIFLLLQFWIMPNVSGKNMYCCYIEQIFF